MDETTATQLQKILLDHQLYLSLTTILRSRSHLGWTFRGSSYCQLIKTVNKVKRLDWAKKYEHFTSIEDSLWYGRMNLPYKWNLIDAIAVGKKVDNQNLNQGMVYNKIICVIYHIHRPKHALKVHIWGGISWNHGQTQNKYSVHHFVIL